MNFTVSIVLFVFLVMVQESSACKEANEKLKKPATDIAKKMDERCKANPQLPVANLMPVIEKLDNFANQPDSELKDKMPAEVVKISGATKDVMSKSDKVNYCDNKERKALMQTIQSRILRFVPAAQSGYNKNCNDFAKWVEGPAGSKFVSEVSALVDKSMA